MCDDLDALWAVRDGEPLDETIARHAELRDLLAELHAYERDLALDAGHRVAEKVGPGETYVTEHGLPCHYEQRAKEAWDGARLLRHLTTDLADPDTGEFVVAVPLRTLVDVIPATTDGATSSKWKVTGLRRHGINPDDYRTREWGPPLLARGPGRKPASD